MSSSPPTRSSPRASLSGLLLLAFVVAGLFTMHGIQASTSPNDMPGISVMAGGHTRAMHTSAAGRPTDHCPTPDCPARHSPGHRHPGGQMCLALLVMAAMFVLAVVLIRRTARRLTMYGPAGPASEHRGRPPPTPSIFHLSVLRL
jgi:hypothetical protein